MVMINYNVNQSNRIKTFWKEQIECLLLFVAPSIFVDFVRERKSSAFIFSTVKLLSRPRNGDTIKSKKSCRIKQKWKTFRINDGRNLSNKLIKNNKSKIASDQFFPRFINVLEAKYERISMTKSWLSMYLPNPFATNRMQEKANFFRN